VVLLLAVSIALNVWFFKRASNKSAPRKQSARSTLIQGIKNVRELTTLRQNFQSVVIFKDSKELLGFQLPGTERKFILKYGGVIVCGSDLENIQITERFAVNRVRIDVPGSRILELYADMKSIQVYDQKAGFFTSIALDDQNREIAKNLEEVRQNSLNGDILRRTDENTRTVLTALAASLGMEAEVVFGSSESGTLVFDPVAQTAPAEEISVTEIPATEAQATEITENESSLETELEAEVFVNGSSEDAGVAAQEPVMLEAAPVIIEAQPMIEAADLSVTDEAIVITDSNGEIENIPEPR